DDDLSLSSSFAREAMEASPMESNAPSTPSVSTDMGSMSPSASMVSRHRVGEDYHPLLSMYICICDSVNGWIVVYYTR
ncbi:hypothetical protein KIPB_016048, partial [Kipferlia bialata]